MSGANIFGIYPLIPGNFLRTGIASKWGSQG